MPKLEIYKNPQNFSLLTEEEINHQIKLLKFWDCLEKKYLKKRYNFSSYREAKKFVDALVDFSEEINHHPQLLFGYKFVEVSIWTHNVDGLSKIDFAYAQDVDDLFSL